MSCPDCGAWLSLPGRPPLSRGADPLVGQRLGDFEILEPIGRGGMGAVYKARQTSLDRLVALKVLSADLAHNDEFLARFEREARAAAAVNHPNIINVYAVGEDRGCRYIAMELVEGESLKDAFRREGALDPRRALEVMKQVAAALARAEAAGIVHRDIKPGNILVDAEGTAKVADFGLAKRSQVDVSVTVTGHALGTPLYMPPEAGRGQPLDIRSDLYSLGATFYHLLAGRPLFQADSSAQLIVKHATERPEPLAVVAPAVDRRLAHIIDRLLRKSPEGRYPSAQALLDELEALGTLAAGPPSPGAAGVDVAAPTATAASSRARAHRRVAHAPSPGPRVPAWAWLGGGALALGLVAFVAWFLSRGGGEGPTTRATPSPRPKAAPSTPPVAKKAGPASMDERREEEAAELWRRARLAAGVSNWAQADARLYDLRRDYGQTRLFAAHREAIEALARQAAAAVARPPPRSPTTLPLGEWYSLFDGQSLDGWRVVERVGEDGGEPGAVHVVGGRIVLEAGRPWTAVALTTEMPTVDYEFEVEAMRQGGRSEFCHLLVPVGAQRTCLSIGAGQHMVLLTSMDGDVRLRNETARQMRLENGRWYRVRLRVVADRLAAWIDDHQVVDLPTAGRRLRALWLASVGPVVIASRSSRAALRNVRVRRIAPDTETRPDPLASGQWVDLFDGRSLEGWRPVRFDGQGEASVEDGAIVLEKGKWGSGVAWTGAVPVSNYEITLEAMRRGGTLDFCNADLPLGAARCVVCIPGGDGHAASVHGIDRGRSPENRTPVTRTFENGRWYAVRYRVTDERVQAWIDGQQVVDLPREGLVFKPERWFDEVTPLAFHCYKDTVAALRRIRLRRLTAPAEPGESEPSAPPRDVAAAERAFQAAFHREVAPAIRQRRYDEAEAALARIARRDDVRDAQEALAAARRHLARLRALWALLEARAAALRPGQPIRVRGMRVAFGRTEEGAIHFTMGEAESQVKLTDMRSSDLLDLLGDGAPSDARGRLALATFLVFDEDAHPERALALLDGLPDESDAAALRQQAQAALASGPPNPPEKKQEDTQPGLTHEEQRRASAVAAGLEWLARAQEGDGHWSSASEGRRGTGRWDLGVTGLALRAFLAGGHTHRNGKHKAVVAKTLAWLAAQQRGDGSFPWTSFYEQGIATLAVCEAYGLSRDPKVGRMAQGAIAYVCKTQPEHGGFRYQGAVPKEEGDLSVTSWQIAAMRAAANAGLRLSRDSARRARTFLRNVHRPGRGSCYLVSSKTPSASMTAAGLYCRLLMRWPDAAEVRADADIVLGHVRAGGDKARRLGHDLYYTYYVTRAMLHMGEPYWTETVRRVHGLLFKAQVTRAAGAAPGSPRGSWDPANHAWARHAGRAYATAMAVLCLTAGDRRLPPDAE